MALAQALTTPRYFAGLDVGQLADPTALAIVERSLRLGPQGITPWFDVRHLERVPLRTPYPQMVEGVRERLEVLKEHCVLLIDATGVGRGIVDLFRQAWTVWDATTQQPVILPQKPRIVSVTLTGGTETRHPVWHEWHVPKREVITPLLLALQRQRIRIAASLPDAQTLLAEARNFQYRIKQSHDEYGAWREGTHDDLVLATAMAIWWGTYYCPQGPSHAHGRIAQSSAPFAARRARVA